MIYDFNLKEIGSGFNIENLCDLPVIKVWHSNVSQKERYVGSIPQEDPDHRIVNCVCKDFRNDYGDWNFDAFVERQEEENAVYYYYHETESEGGAR